MTPDTQTQDLRIADIWQVSVEKYQQMVQKGSLAHDDPVELLEGFLVRR
jgi:hypothetical protein